MVDQKQILGTEEATALLIQELMRNDNPKVMTDLSDEEVGVLSLLSTIGEDLKIKELKNFCKNFSLYRISRFRLGRREMTDIASWSSGDAYGRKKKVKSVRDLFGGMRS